MKYEHNHDLAVDSPRTLYDKLWDAHVVTQWSDDTALLYIDRHLVHEVSSAQAFEGLRLKQRRPWRKDAHIATPDHNIATKNRDQPIQDDVSRIQVQALDDNCAEFDIPLFKLNDPRQGIVHVIGPEQGLTLPGMTVVCGDSHTSTHGALAALAHGIGTSEVEHVLATQCLVQRKMKNMRVDVLGELSHGVAAKDLALAIIREIGTAGGTGYAIEFTGSAIRALSIEGRMTLCNMAIEAGARVGLVAVDDKTLDYVKGRPFAPIGADWDLAVSQWQDLVSDEAAAFDVEITIDASTLAPQITWGTSPEMAVSVNEVLPDPANEPDINKRNAMAQAYAYVGLRPGLSPGDISPDKVFIGSCTNARIEDLRVAAQVVKGQRVAPNIKLAMVVPGSGLVKQQAETEGLDKIFLAAGFEWRAPGCSLCLGMNDDQLSPGERCAATSNRNFEGRQGYGSFTHLVSPAMAAAAAIKGRFVDVSQMLTA